MNVETIREWLTRKPFEPFSLRLSNGEIYEVKHPELVAIGKNRIAIYNPDVDQFAFVALIHVNSVKTLQSA